MLLSNLKEVAMSIIFVEKGLSNFLQKPLVFLGRNFMPLDGLFHSVLENYHTVHDLLDPEVSNNFELFPFCLDVCHTLVENTGLDH